MHHLTAFGDNNLDEIILDYTQQAIILCDKGAVKRDKIRQLFEEMFKLIPIGSLFEMKQLTISDNTAHIIWATKSATADMPFGTDTFIIENDKMIVHTVPAFEIMATRKHCPLQGVLHYWGTRKPWFSSCSFIG